MSLHRLSYIILLCLAFPFSEGWAQMKLNPVAVLLQVNGDEPPEPKTLEAGEEVYVGAAPLEFRFMANIESPSPTLRYEWNFAYNEEFTEYYLPPRFEEETTCTFTTSGIFYVRLQVSDTETEDGPVSVSDVFTIQVPESELKIPNAFSPNGDGINDIFKVSYKSLVSFNAVVFNRWGQKLYQWGFSEIDKGWDGTSGGHQVPAGVYFIVIEARGSDGVVYKHKGDINILR
ncbi:gliding motility-associated C-terminal domain-containing protein [Bacteroides sp.]